MSYSYGLRGIKPAEVTSRRPARLPSKGLSLQELLHNIPSATVSPLFVGDVAGNGFYLRSGIPRTARQTASAHHLNIGNIIAYI